MGIYIYYNISPSDNTTINDNVIEGNDGVGLRIACVYPNNSSGSSNINNNIIKRNKNGISVLFSNTNLTNNIIADNIGNGVDIWSQAGDNVLINNNIINNTGCGLIIGSNSGDTVLINNNNIAKNGDRGVRIDSFVNNIFLTNNTITENKTSYNGGGVYFTCSEENAIAYLYNNIIWRNEGNEGDDIYNDSHLYAITYAHNNNFHDVAGRQFTEDLNNIDTDPLFVDSEQGDYHLLSGSPCIDKGTADAPELPSTDYEGDSRIIGSAPDIGADEFDPSNPPTTTSTSSTTTTPISTTTTSLPQPPSDCLSEELYGEHSEETELLRYIRDNVLSQTLTGREIIKLYYQLMSDN